MCPPFSQMGSVWFQKKKMLWAAAAAAAAGVSESTFSKAWSWRKKTIRVSSCASNHVSKRRYQPWLHGMRGVRGGRLSWTRFSTMVWSPSCYPNTNKQRRNIGVNDRGGGWRRVGGRAERSRAPEPWKVKNRCALRTLPDPAPDGTPTPLLSLLQTSSPLSTTFHNLPHLCKGPRHQSCLHGYMKSFSDLELGKLLTALYWSSSPL